MAEPATLRKQLLTMMQEGSTDLSDDAFNDIALRIFRFQFEHNLPYRKYCQRRIEHMAVDHWLQVPAVPTAAFKEAALVTGSHGDAQAVFKTSGTTQGQEKRGAHYVLDLELYEHSLLPAFQKFVLGDDPQLPIASLVPAWRPDSESSLSYMVTCVQDRLGTPANFLGVHSSGIVFEELNGWLLRHIDAGQPVCIVGTSLAFVHWFDQLQESGTVFVLPPGSRVMDTGGFKGSTRAITSGELRAQYDALLGIDARHVINEYGMTEMLSQFYDAHLDPKAEMSVKRGPAWVRSAIVDPETLEPLPAGQQGLLRHFDLANLFSVSAIQTEDLAVARGDGFELRGRIAGAAPRGCSIAMDLFLNSTRA